MVWYRMVWYDMVWYAGERNQKTEKRPRATGTGEGESLYLDVTSLFLGLGEEAMWAEIAFGGIPNPCSLLTFLTFLC